MTVDRIKGASVWEQEMYAHLCSHAKVEGEILETYKELAKDDERSPAFRYLARMILEDEVRHHQVFDDLAEAIRQMSELRDEDEPIPSIRGLRADRDAIKEITKRLLEVERGDVKELKHLANELKDFGETTLWGLLVDLMLDDTHKHIKILRFIEERSQDPY